MWIWPSSNRRRPCSTRRRYWTPRRWSDPKSNLVGFEQLLYLRQPGYGPSYIIGKLQLDELFARASHDSDNSGRPFVLGEVFARIMRSGIVPPALIAAELDEDVDKK